MTWERFMRPDEGWTFRLLGFAIAEFVLFGDGTGGGATRRPLESELEAIL
jgi:hypothetical protein